MSARCNGCGRVDALTDIYHCTWPDGRTTVERHCSTCRVSWQPQLKSLGATFEADSPDGRPSRGVLRSI